MSTGNAYKNVILDGIYGDGRADGMPATVYVALFTTSPGDDGSGTEVSAADYTRISVANNSTNFPNASGNMKRIGITLTWPAAEEDWGVIAFWAIMDSATPGTGNVIHHGRGGGVTPPTHLEGSVFRIPANSLTIRLP